MKTYHQNGIVSEDKSIISEDEVFAIQCDTENGAPSFFYPGDNLIREIDLALIEIADLFVDIYLDLIVKIVFELENPIGSFSSITKLKSSEKLWGNRKQLRMNGTQDTIFEDCIVIKQIEALRNEAVHDGTWEFAPKVFLRIEDSTIIERYMLFPDFEEGHLATVKNRRRPDVKFCVSVFRQSQEWRWKTGRILA